MIDAERLLQDLVADDLPAWSVVAEGPDGAEESAAALPADYRHWGNGLATVYERAGGAVRVAWTRWPQYGEQRRAGARIAACGG